VQVLLLTITLVSNICKPTNRAWSNVCEFVFDV